MIKNALRLFANSSKKHIETNYYYPTENKDLVIFMSKEHKIISIENNYNDLNNTNLQSFIKLHTIHDLRNPDNDKWIITELLRKYNISTAEILVSLYQTRNPSRPEYVQCNSLHLTLSNAKYLINTNCTEDYWHVDYCSGSPIKAIFPKNINTHDMIIYRQKHDKASSYKCINKIADLILNKHINYNNLS